MHTYILLKSGEIVILWSDNTEDETINAYPLSKKDTFDVEWDTTKEYPYSEILNRDSNLVSLKIGYDRI